LNKSPLVEGTKIKANFSKPQAPIISAGMSIAIESLGPPSIQPCVISRPAERKFPLVQALRALAALAIAFTHTAYNGLTMTPGAYGLARVFHAFPWVGGVDVFFFISGFVIAWSSHSLFGHAGAARQFMAKRLARIVPLYWLMTTLFLASLLLLPGAINGDIGGPAYIVKSYLFIPAARSNGLVQPALGLGWTLNFEMFFYFVFALFLRFTEIKAVISATVLLGGFVLLGQTGILPGTILDTWSQPIVLEFCAGMFLALVPGRVTLPDTARIVLVLAALALMVAAPPWPRIFGLGLPAMALVAAAVTGPKEGRLPHLEIWLVRLGDASYALYLVHPFVMRAGALLWTLLYRPGGPIAYVVLCLIFSQAVALALHRLYERPVTTWLRRRIDLVFRLYPQTI
jgi:peptidoglycan/LPS O-acetylase OafA/YrhL